MNHQQHTTRAAALAAGAATYFTGKSCKHGHVAARDTLAGVCVDCRKEQQRQYRQRTTQRFQQARANAAGG